MGELGDLARRAVERYLLDPGEAIDGVEEGTAATIVRAGGRTWSVREIDRARQFARSPGYTLIDITRGVIDGYRADGVAALADGLLFHLNDAEEFRAFFAAARGLLTPRETAGLLAFYQSEAPAAESLVVGDGDVEWLFPAATPGALDALLPQFGVGDDGSLDLAYCTLYLAPDPADRFTRVNLNRWHVGAAADGPLTWTVEPLARNMDSPRYRP